MSKINQPYSTFPVKNLVNVNVSTFAGSLQGIYLFKYEYANENSVKLGFFNWKMATTFHGRKFTLFHFILQNS